MLAEIKPLPFKEFQFHGFEGKRRVVSFGWRYDYAAHKPFPTDPIPPFLREACRKVQTAAAFLLPDLKQVLITEYPPGSAKEGGSGCSLFLEPRSAYFLADEARWQWEHSIPPVESLRYSITFRNRR